MVTSLSTYLSGTSRAVADRTYSLLKDLSMVYWLLADATI